MTARFIKDASTADVVRHFLRMEASRESIRRQWPESVEWIKLPDEELLITAREFALEREENPALAWTVGTADNSFYKMVKAWSLSEIRLDELYTCGVRKNMEPDLNAVAGNLKRFFDTGRANSYPSDFEIRAAPVERQLLMCIDNSRDDKDGCLELIDGAHRAIAMIADGTETCRAYVATLVE